MKRIGVLTSGGDAPGMNAAIRAVTRTALDIGWEVSPYATGTRLAPRQTRPLTRCEGCGRHHPARGHVLGTARSPEFHSEQGQREAVAVLHRHGIDALVITGGYGSQAGAHALHELGFPVVGIASTIDSDVYGADIMIGVDTAPNIALEAIDRLWMTAASHHRVFIVEVMGRDCGYLALMAGIAGGAEAVVIPEAETDPEELAELRAASGRGRSAFPLRRAASNELSFACSTPHSRRSSSRIPMSYRRGRWSTRSSAPHAAASMFAS